MSGDVTKPTNWRVRPAKTQISLGIRPDWSEYSLFAWRNIGSLATHWAQRRRLCEDANSDLSLRWAHIHFVGFVMSRLKWTSRRELWSHKCTNTSIITTTHHRYSTNDTGDTWTHDIRVLVLGSRLLLRLWNNWKVRCMKWMDCRVRGGLWYGRSGAGLVW